MRGTRALWVGVALISVGFAGCDSTEPGTPALVSLTAPTQTAFVGETVQITARVLDGGDEPVNDAKITYSSSKAAVASVDDRGLITARTPGSTIITGRAGGAEGTLGITVYPPATGG